MVLADLSATSRQLVVSALPTRVVGHSLRRFRTIHGDPQFPHSFGRGVADAAGELPQSEQRIIYINL